MKVNQLGTLAMIVVLGSFTAACGGSPTSPTAANPSAGGGDQAASVKLSTFQQDVAVGQICAAQTVTFDENGNPIPDASTTDTPAMTCESAPATEQPQADGQQAGAAAGDSTSMSSARFVRRLHR
jgi:hypothetical protein